ncbi:MAG: NAD-dependent epimerase/dehydratase family protein [Acidobacteriota bacterium]
MKKVLIAGCGDLGTRAGLLLASAGHEVWGGRRSARKVPAPIRGLPMDLSSPDGIPPIPEAPWILYAVASDAFSDAAYRSAYVEGVRHLLAAVRSQHPAGTLRRLVYVSSTSVYAQSDGEWVDESSPAEPTSFGGQRLLEGEALVREAAAEDGFEAVALRLSGLYGPGRTRLLDGVRSGRLPCYKPPVFTNRIHIEDAARALVHVTEIDSPEPVYLGVDRAPVLDGEVKRWLAGRLGVPEPGTAAPSAGSRAMRSNKRCSSARLEGSGFRFLYPDYRAGYAPLLPS